MVFSIAGTAAALTVKFVNGTTQTTTALTGFSTTGAMMDGMTVTATFNDATQQTLYWADTVVDAGGVNGITNWSLNMSGDTFSGYWNLLVDASLTLTNLFIDAGTGDTVFDVIYGSGDLNDYHSPGSALGRPFTTAYIGDLTATYRDRVAVGGYLYGDLYRTLTLDFGSNGFSGNMDLNFTADTDNLKIAGDIKPANPVPEPATLLLLGTGLIGLAGSQRKKFFRKS